MACESTCIAEDSGNFIISLSFNYKCTIVLLDCNEIFFNFRLSNLIKMVYYTTLMNASTTCKKFRPVITICLARMSMLHTFFTIHRVESSHGTAHISSRQFFATLCNFFKVIFVQSRSLRSRPTSSVRLSDKSDYKSLCRSTSVPSEHLSQVKLPHPNCFLTHIVILVRFIPLVIDHNPGYKS